MSNDDIGGGIQRHYGQSLDDVWNAMTAAPRRRMCAFTWGCAESPPSARLRARSLSPTRSPAIAWRCPSARPERSSGRIHTDREPPALRGCVRRRIARFRRSLADRARRLVPGRACCRCRTATWSRSPICGAPPPIPRVALDATITPLAAPPSSPTARARTRPRWSSTSNGRRFSSGLTPWRRGLSGAIERVAGQAHRPDS